MTIEIIMADFQSILHKIKNGYIFQEWIPSINSFHLQGLWGYTVWDMMETKVQKGLLDLKALVAGTVRMDKRVKTMYSCMLAENTKIKARV